jgi:hypothetical protein
MAHPTPLRFFQLVRNLGIGQFINPSIHRGVCGKPNRLTVSTVSRVSTHETHGSKPFLLFTVEKPLKRLLALCLLQPLDESRG